MTFNKTLLTISLCSALSPAALANETTQTEPEFYVGAGYGQYSIQWDDEDTEFDENAAVLKAYGGIQFNKYLGAELSYLNFDEANDFDSNAEIQGIGLAGTLSAPLHERVSVYAKGGWFQWNAELKTTIPIIGSVSEETDGGDWFYGVGLKLGLTENLDLRFEYERFELDDNIKPELDVASAALQYSF